MFSDGEYIGGGAQRVFHPANGTITIGGSKSQVSVGVSGGTHGDSYPLEFAAPPGHELTPGVYDGAQRAAFREAGRPGIDVGGDGRGCNTIEGRFEVKRIETNTEGRVTSFWVVYEQRCEGGVSALFGEVRYNVPGDGGQLSVGPRDLRWPDADQWAATTIAPVAVVNASASPIAV